jgi:rubrerythrin
MSKKNRSAPPDSSLRKAVDFAIEMEKMGALFYKLLAAKFIHDEEIEEIFTALAEEEADHQQQFESLLNSIPPDAINPKHSDKLAMQREIADLFIGNGALNGIHSREDALDRALQLEKQTLDHYLGMKNLLGENRALTALIATERGHMRRLLKYKIVGVEVREISDGHPEEPEVNKS